MIVYLRANIWQHTSGWWVAECPDLDIMTQGTDQDDAHLMLKDAIAMLTCCDTGVVCIEQDEDGYVLKMDTKAPGWHKVKQIRENMRSRQRCS